MTEEGAPPTEKRWTVVVYEVRQWVVHRKSLFNSLLENNQCSSGRKKKHNDNHYHSAGSCFTVISRKTLIYLTLVFSSSLQFLLPDWLIERHAGYNFPREPSPTDGFTVPFELTTQTFLWFLPRLSLCGGTRQKNKIRGPKLWAWEQFPKIKRDQEAYKNKQTKLYENSEWRRF